MIIAATPFLLAASGELITERSGVLNLGVEGLMLMGAVSAFAVANLTGSSGIGILAGAAAGVLTSLIFAVLTLSFLANQAATGLALTIFGIGFSGLIGQGFVGVALEPLAKFDFFGLAELTAVTRILFAHDLMVYFAILMCFALWWFLDRSRYGLILRAVGDSHDSAHALGYNVIGVRYLAVLFGGAMAGLGGAYMSLAYTPLWGENMTAGRGWIALALVVFASWRPMRVLVGSFLFAAVTQLQFYGQDWGIALPSQFLAMGPYLATIVALVLISRDRSLIRANAPACLGQPFRADR